MHDYIKYFQKNIQYIFLFLGITGLIFIAILDIFYWETGLIFKVPPNFLRGYIIRITIIFFSTFFIIFGLFFNNRITIKIKNNEDALIYKIRIQEAIFLSLIFIYLLIYQPIIFSGLSEEDKLTEWVSAILLFCSSIIFFLIFYKTFKRNSFTKIIKYSFVFIALLFLLITLEEVSWFQRVIRYESPELFSRNDQNAFNLHNFLTIPSEIFYYFGAFLFLVVLPYLSFIFDKHKIIKQFEMIIPNQYILILGAIASAYNYATWNIIFTQITFFSTVFILLILSFYSKENRNLYIISLVIIFIIQLSFIIFGKNLIRFHEVSEYRELMIPFAFFVYSISTYLKLRNKLEKLLVN